MSGLQTEFPFTLPKGYVDDDGTLHKTGVMRLACARDEIEPLRDGRVKENEAYATVIVLARVVEGLLAGDLMYLQDLYRIVNFQDPSILEALEPGAPFPQTSVEVG